MSNIEHTVKHYYQPTNHTCSQSALAILLSFFGKSLTAEEIAAKIPVNKNDKGEDWGTINQQLATWCLSQGFEVDMYTADFEIIDLSWIKLTRDKLLERMELTKDHREVPALGKEWSKIYTQSYIDFMKTGGELHLMPYMTTKLIDDLLPASPLLLCVCYNVLYTSGRSKDIDLRKAETDDLNGKLTNHSIVIYGKDSDGSYLIADPYKEPGLHAIEPERLLAAMTAAQMECDNLLFQLKTRR
ncbi:MAG: C39 family peptidase [Paracoccaceae bacterium]